MMLRDAAIWVPSNSQLSNSTSERRKAFSNPNTASW